MTLIRRAHCKVNLLLNILRRRPDGFHELETVFQPVPIYDRLEFETASTGIALKCSIPELPCDASNLVYRAAQLFLTRAALTTGVKIGLEKGVPLAAGLGGGSGDAAATLLALNELHGFPLSKDVLLDLASQLGSDVPFFLQDQPALGLGRGEVIKPVPPFAALKGIYILLIHPGFGVSTAWAYQNLARYPQALQGRPGRAEALARQLDNARADLPQMDFYNSLEAPVLEKHPILRLYQDFLREQGALSALMSGSGSTTFALAPSKMDAERLQQRFLAHFGGSPWTAIAPLS